MILFSLSMCMYSVQYRQREAMGDGDHPAGADARVRPPVAAQRTFRIATNSECFGGGKRRLASPAPIYNIYFLFNDDRQAASERSY